MLSAGWERGQEGVCAEAERNIMSTWEADLKLRFIMNNFPKMWISPQF